jgi:2-iminobutanoate/2-iminopropanoate deaminase
MPRKAIQPQDAVTVGPYSPAVEAGGFVYLSGQGPMDPASRKLVEGDVQVQAKQVFKNLFAILAAAGLAPADVVKVNVYLTDMGDFTAMNEVYALQFDPPYPARTTVGVASLPLGIKVEIEMIARRA